MNNQSLWLTWNRGEHNIISHFEHRVSTQGDSLALKQGELAWTYNQLNSLANRMANGMIKTRGDHPEPVAILLPQGPWAVAAMLAVLKAGKFYVPLDPGFPVSRNHCILENSNTRLILTSPDAHLDGLEISNGDLSILTPEELANQGSPENPGVNLLPETLAYIIYTSGSTGKPKGVFQNHFGVVHNALRQIEVIGFQPADRATLLYSPSVMGTARDIFNIFLSGGTLYPFDLRAQGFKELAGYLAGEQITVFHTISSVFRTFITHHAGPEHLQSIRLLILGGEAVLKSDYLLFRQHFPSQCRLVTGLGSTETGTICMDILDHHQTVETSTLPLGRPVRDVVIQLKDENGNLTPPGDEGEICVRHPALALGYWNSPEQTAAVFQSIHESIREYRTGDTGKVLPDGKLLHCGRRDHQVKIRGYRIDLPDIETNILASGWVTDVTVIGRRMENDQDRLFAYYVPAQSRSETPAHLRSYLHTRLPDYMVPVHLIPLTALPLTPNGKVDRSALPVIDFSQSVEELEPPQSATESALLAIWQDILKNQSISPRDNFFSVGGDSFHANTMLLMAETKFGRRLPLSVLIEHNTIRSLASLIDQQRTPALLVPINPSGSRPILFAAPGGGGDSLYFRNLARYLPPDQPFYGIQLNDDPEWRKQFPSIEMIAQLFIAEISAIQPHGPYFFAGHSFGGYVVLEIARHFRAAGEEIGLLAFWDTHPPGPRQQAPFFDRILIHVHNIRDLPPRQRLSYLLGRLEMINLRLTRHPLWRRFLRKQGFLPKNTLNTSQIAKFSFDPQPFPGDGVLFKARERHWYVRWDPMSRWTRYITGKLEVISVPGDHNTLMFEPHVAHLAAAMLPVLEQAQKRSVHSLS